MAKAAKPVARYYVDANVFLSWIEGHAERRPAIEALFRGCEAGECELYTSELSVVEVAFAKAEKDGRALDPAVEAMIDNLWHPEFALQMVEVHQLVIADAKNLIRLAMEVGWSFREQWSLKAADAVHLATAARHHANAFLTYDRGLRKMQNLNGLVVREPDAPMSLLFPPTTKAWRPKVGRHWRSLTPTVRPMRPETMLYG